VKNLITGANIMIKVHFKLLNILILRHKNWKKFPCILTGKNKNIEKANKLMKINEFVSFRAIKKGK
jgi:hypothetical protein